MKPRMLSLGNMWSMTSRRSNTKERRLERTVREVLTGTKFAGQFRKAHLGEDYFRITLPFVQTDGGRPNKVIKPLFLAHDQPTKILIHGGDWLQRLRRLRKHDFLPANVLIPVDAPGVEDQRHEAFLEICGELKAEKFQVNLIGEKEKIRAFAEGNIESRLCQLDETSGQAPCAVGLPLGDT